MLMNKHIDFISTLPTELSCSIFDELDLKTKTNCLYLSNQWYQLLLSHPTTWSVLSIDDLEDNQKVIQLITHVLPLIAQHVRHLILDTRHQNISWQYIATMQRGYFTHMKSLQLNSKAIRHLESNDLMVLPQILSEMGHTLTRLDVDLETRSMNIYDLLCGLPHLDTLKFKAMSGPEIIDNHNNKSNVLSTMRHPLKDLALDVDGLQGTSMLAESLVQHCHHIRRLVLNNCLHDLATDLFEKHCPYLQILAYNYDDEDVDHLDETNNHHRGLRKLYVSKYPSFFRPHFRYVLQLIYGNRTTLEVIDIGDTVTLDDPSFDQLLQPSQQSFEDQQENGYLELMNLKSLAIRYDNGHPIAALLFQSIPFYKALTTLKVPKGQNTHRIVDQLITSFPQPLQNLKLDITLEDEREDIADTCLQRLFKHYTTFNPVPTLPMTASLETIHLKDNRGILTDNTLYILSKIPTIRDFGLDSGSRHITAQGLYAFFKKLTNSLTHVSLTRLLYINDADMIAFADLLTQVTYLKMEHLHCIFDYGIFSLIEKAIRLKNLEIYDCPVVSSRDAIISFAKSKRIEHVKICVK